MIRPTHDGSIDIATGRSRKDTSWKNKKTQWSAFLTRISETHRTAETYAEYLAAKKPRQDEIKDIGGFVGGYLSGGRRKSGNVIHRQLLTLDVDFGEPGIWENFTLIYGNAAAVYSTHKHTPETPRLRLIMPLSREVARDEYAAIARRIAADIDIEFFDPTTYQPERLMYWPSTAKDGAYEFQWQDGPWLDPDEVLARYVDWKDSSEWPVSARESSVVQRIAKKQGDPLEKPGVIGAFCRTYSIHEVIDTYLSDVYEACDVENRYTYKEGSTGAGLVVYDDKYAYSHHGSDPVSGKLCNAFDLVRIHKYGLKDEGSEGEKASMDAMYALASADPNVCRLTAKEKMDSARGDFAEPLQDDEAANDEWLGQLIRDKKNNIKNTIDNALLILRNDSLLKNSIALNLFNFRETVLKDLPWRKARDGREFNDADESGLRHYLEKSYGFTGKDKINDALIIALRENGFHPIKEYFKSLPAWDGASRVDSLFIDYMGADDTEYTRTVTRKSVVAAVARIFDPGVKFDNMVVLVGAQGIGKSTILDRLGVRWFTDSFNFHMLKGDSKRGEEQIQGAWIVEISELAGIGKADLESAKSFLSRREDKYRAAYGKRTSNYPRQCVFFGTTNNNEFLRDVTGNRRFWPIPTNPEKAAKSMFTDMHPGEVEQIWAEAFRLYKQSEPLFLSQEISDQAVKMQEIHTESDERVGMILSYLDTKLPTDWSQMDLWAKRAYLHEEEEIKANGTVLRAVTCAAEIWIELFNGTIKDLNRPNAKFINDVLRKTPGWTASKSNRRFANCGVQRAFERVNKPSEKVNKSEQTINNRSV